MSRLETAALWIAALGLAAFLIMRVGRRERLLLDGRISPRLVRMVAVLVVAFGWRPADAHAAEPPPDACQTIPPPAAPPPPGDLFDPPRAPLGRADLERAHPADPHFAREAHAHFTAARRAAPAELASLLARADRAARFDDARLMTIREVGQPVFRPWMSKAGRPVGYEEIQIPKGFHEVFGKKLAVATGGTWHSEGTIDLAIVTSSGASLVRAGVSTPLPEGKTIRLRRFDLIQAGNGPLTLRHADLGELVVPAGQLVASWHLPRHLGAQGRAKVDALVRRAGACDAAAQRELEWILPAAHEAIASAIATPIPEGIVDPLRGRAALRLLLALYLE